MVSTSPQRKSHVPLVHAVRECVHEHCTELIYPCRTEMQAG